MREYQKAILFYNNANSAFPSSRLLEKLKIKLNSLNMNRKVLHLKSFVLYLESIIAFRKRDNNLAHIEAIGCFFKSVYTYQG